MREVKRKIQFLLGLGICIASCLSFRPAFSQDSLRNKKSDSLKYLIINPYLPNFRPRDRYGDPFSNPTSSSPFLLKDPKNKNVDIAVDTGMHYNIYERMGNLNFRPNSSMSFRDFDKQQDRIFRKDYFQNKSLALDGESAVSGRNLLPKLYVSPILDRIFGGSYVELIPKGFVTLDLGGSYQRIQNPSIPIRQQSNGGLEFDQQINLNVTGKIGEKLKVTTNFDTNNSFDFQNNMKVEYTGFKEDLLKKLEIGNVSLPLNNSLITGAQNLFGVKAQLQFGKLSMTTIATTQRGKQSNIRVAGNSSGGASQGRPFEIVGSNYDDNRHFFLAQFFRDNFEKWLSKPPQIFSGINITRLEVYSVNRQNDTQSQRDILAFMDMGETNKIYNGAITQVKSNGSPAANGNNDLFSILQNNPGGAASTAQDSYLQGKGFVSGTDYEKITSARKLSTTEYTFNAQLGYLTLQRKLQGDEAIAVAFEYTYNGQVFKVGELTEDYSNRASTDVIYLKMLRPRSNRIKDNAGHIIPTWNLMMKNIYNLNVSQLSREGFQLRVIYRDDRTGIDNPQLQDGTGTTRATQLIQVFGLDRLNPYNDPQPDGNFDFVDGLTINSSTGLIIFPYLEPFNNPLRNLFDHELSDMQVFLKNKYLYDTLYHTTKAEAELVTTKNKFYIVGSFKAGSGRDIVIQGFNITPGSVKVYAGGTPLREGTDYTVDYTFGKVTILNEGILSSGKDIDITYEQQDPFAFQTRSLLGTRFDYKLSDDINLGGTFLYYNERPLITRNLIGNEPARNIQYGLDFNMKKNSRFLTKMVDALPFLQTKETSTVSVNAEFAQLLPGTSNTINGDGTSFIDDFENSATPYSLISPQAWKLAAAPKGDPSFDPSGGASDDVRAGFRRAKLSWYTIDNLFYLQGGSSYKPKNITDDDLKNHYVRAVSPQEIFPYFDPYVGNFYESILNFAYYPAERGQYNYNNNVGEFDPNTGRLTKPAQNWAGVTTAIRTNVDFDAANIEYIEFWLMDPFINDSKFGKVDDGSPTAKPNTTGGKLIFHVGSVSEDVERDGLQAFENGLPRNGDLTSGVTSNNWGYVTTQQYLNNAFDNSNDSRKHQDVGLDGMSNDVEKQKFASYLGLNPVAIDDPSADDFHYFLGQDLDNQNATVLGRYKNINGMDGNSPVLTGASAFAASGSTIPDNEDINQDNTLSDLEEYYSYSIDLKPGQLNVGNKYIVDKISPQAYNGQVTWYLFRIPIRNFDAKVGDINGFKTIKYIRTILTGFQEPVVLRMAKFRSVGQKWRQYAGNLQESSFKPVPEVNTDNFSVSTVNIEENGQPDAEKPGYVEPLNRDRDVTSTVSRRLNEQSCQLCVTGLPDGDARAMYKNVSMDLFNYQRIKMFLSVHGPLVKDNDVKAFLRLGTDFDQNYYEVEVSLKVTPPNTRDGAKVWPEENQIDLDLNDLYALKLKRDRENFSLLLPYPLAGPSQSGKHGLRVMGRPDLSQLKMIMIGVRNPRTSDQQPFDVCIWADELRLTDFDQTPGWASNVVVNAKLADLGTISGSFRHIGFGYGNVQSKISERARGETNQFDISGNIALDKLLPRKTGLKIPMYFSYESLIIDPKYDPANPDLRIAAVLKSFATDKERSDYLNIIQDRSYRKSLNFTNVRKTKLNKDAKTHIYDIENFSFTYSYSEATQTNFNLLENTRKNVKGAVAWQFQSKAKGFEPFKNVKLKSKYFQIIKDFNFNLVPSSISVRGELDRSFTKMAYRNFDSNSTNSQPNFQKYFTFNRYYNLTWNFTKSLKLDYNATANAIIDEPAGDIDTQQKRDTIINNLKNFGRMKYFEQNFTVNYTFPLDKFPVTNWLAGDYRYGVGYNWRAGPLEKVDSLKLGNTIQNTRNEALSGKIDMVKLYNKIGFLKKINTPPKPPPPLPKDPKERAKILKADTLPHPPDLKLVKGLLRFIMSMRSINGTYTITQGTILPGFTKTPHLLGLDDSWSAPGTDFILGGQDPFIAQRMADKGWLTHNKNLTAPFTQNETRDLSIRANMEPSNDLKIQLDLKKTSNTSFQEIFRDSTGNGFYTGLSPNRSGSYKISFISIGTSFMNNNDLNSDVFNRFKDNINIIRNRFNAVNGSAKYENQSQDVLIPAFIAAYSGGSANSVGLSPFPSIPLPNWRLDYNGLNKISALKDAFTSITLSHAYTSSYSVMNYSNSLEYSYDANVKNQLLVNSPVENYNTGNFYGTVSSATSQQVVPVYIINQVMISETFAPLIGITAKTKSKLSLTFNYKTKRDVSLSVSNAQITEVNGKDWSFELGFTKNNMKLPFRDKGRIITLKNDVTVRMTVGVSSNETIQRRIDEGSSITNGNINFQLRPNLSYVVNKKLTLQMYMEHTTNEPLVSNSYNRTTTKGGFKVMFNLSQ